MEALAKVDLVWIIFSIVCLTLIRVALRKSKASWVTAVAETCDTARWVLAIAFLLIRPFVAQAFYIPSLSMAGTLDVGDRLVVEKIGYRVHEPDRGDVVVFAAPWYATQEKTEGIDFIKRLIAKPTDTIEVRGAMLKIGNETIASLGDDKRGDAVREYLRTHLDIASNTRVKLHKDFIEVGSERWTKATLATKLSVHESELQLIPGCVFVNHQAIDEPYTYEDPGYNMPPTKIPADQFFFLGDNRNDSHDSHAWGTVDRWRLVGRGIVTFWPPSRLGKIQ
jgi:signal peptidase I